VCIPLEAAPFQSGPEQVQLSSWLDFYRDTLALKCAGLSIEQLALPSVPPSTLTLRGLLRHTTFVEQHWFQLTLAGLDAEPLYEKENDPDGDVNDRASASLEDVERHFRKSCERSRELCQGLDLDTMARAPRPGREVHLRWIYIHMVEEYARHCGHADLLRECIDGVTGY
jgi:uncharacterized damage-inducible protein DinB